MIPGFKNGLPAANGGNDINTVLLIHCDGADASTSFTDKSIGGATHTVTANGTAQVDTAESQFGGASLLLDGNSDYLSVPYHSDFNFAGDFTVECWFNTSSAPAAATNIVGRWDNDTNELSYTLMMDSTGEMKLQIHDGSTSSVNSSGIFDDGVWHHAALVYDSSANTATIYVDGAQEAQVTGLGTLTTDTADLHIGIKFGGTDRFFDGWIDEIRISNVARYTGTFTPPTKAFS